MTSQCPIRSEPRPLSTIARVRLGEYLAQVANTYNRFDGLSTPTQVMLKEAHHHLKEHVPPGLEIKGSGGKGVATHTPWIGFFNPDETDTPQRGIYVVFLFSADLEELVLTLNQGMEYLRKELGDKPARDRLSCDAGAIRTELERIGAVADRWDKDMDLRSRGTRQLAYVAGNIASVTYEVGDLPEEERLAADLDEILMIYERAIDVKQNLLLEAPGIISTPSSRKVSGRSAADPLAGFKPKSASDYTASLAGRVLTKSRRHERVVVEFSEHCKAQGFDTTTPHPCDLVVHTGKSVYLVEVKIVYRGNVTTAVRDAVGQLLAYSYFLFPDEKPKLVAVFSEAIGSGYEIFLKGLGISAVWWENDKWTSSSISDLVI